MTHEEFTGVTFNDLDASGTRILRSSEFSVVNSTEIVLNITYWQCNRNCRAFSVAGPIIWNSLPDELRDDTEDSTIILVSHWKHCFSVCTIVPSAWEVDWTRQSCYINRRFTYLLTIRFYKHKRAVADETVILSMPWSPLKIRVYRSTYSYFPCQCHSLLITVIIKRRWELPDWSGTCITRYSDTDRQR